jgi:hypothetical protein
MRCGCCYSPHRRKMVACQVCGTHSHIKCMEGGRACPGCQSAALVTGADVIRQDELTMTFKASAAVGGFRGGIGLLYDRAQRALILFATKPGQKFRIVSAGALFTSVSKTKLHDRCLTGVLSVYRPLQDRLLILEDGCFCIEGTAYETEYVVAAGGLAVYVNTTFAPSIDDCRAPVSDTRTRRWLRLPWNDAVCRRNDSWLPPVFWRAFRHIFNVGE